MTLCQLCGCAQMQIVIFAPLIGSKNKPFSVIGEKCHLGSRHYSLSSPRWWQVIHGSGSSPSVSCGILDAGSLNTTASSLMHNEAFIHIILTLLIHHYNSSWALPHSAARHFNQHQCQQYESSWLIVKVSAYVCVCVRALVCVCGHLFMCWRAPMWACM